MWCEWLVPPLSQTGLKSASSPLDLAGARRPAVYGMIAKQSVTSSGLSGLAHDHGLIREMRHAPVETEPGLHAH